LFSVAVFTYERLILSGVNNCRVGNCRNAKNMPDGVRAAVKKIITSEGGRAEDDAERYLDEMDRTRRYQAETWS